MDSWRASAAWRDYKAVFSEAENARSLRDLERLRRELAKARPALSRLFQEHPALVRSLDDVLNDRLQARENVLLRAQTLRQRSSRHPGLSRREAQPDLSRSMWEVSSSVALLEHAEAAVRGLRAAAVDDPWVEGQLVPAWSEAREALEAGVESLERLHPGRPEAAPVLDQARGALSSARALLDGPSPRR